MASTELITMSMQEADRLKTIQLVIDGNLRASTAAQCLNLTKCQMDRLVQRYRQDGIANSSDEGTAATRHIDDGCGHCLCADPYCRGRCAKEGAAQPECGRYCSGNSANRSKAKAPQETLPAIV